MVHGRVMIGLKEIDDMRLAFEERNKLISEINAIAKKRERPEKQPPPEGGISLTAAEKRYGINHGTISRWVKSGYISVLLRTKNWLYISEADLIKVIEVYKSYPGRGRKTIKRQLIKN